VRNPLPVVQEEVRVVGGVLLVDLPLEVRVVAGVLLVDLPLEVRVVAGVLLVDLPLEVRVVAGVLLVDLQVMEALVHLKESAMELSTVKITMTAQVIFASIMYV
jgi:hypothetical protein